MSPSEGKNPEHRSNAAMMCFCAGAGLTFLSWLLGLGAMIGAALSGGDPALVVGSVLAAIGIVMAGFIGFALMAVGGVWMFAQVLADRHSDAEKRYRDVER